MIAYKAFNLGLTCRGFRFEMGMNVTEKANCSKNGFHCAENPLDCLTYYPNLKKAVYCIVEALGDIDEDGSDTKIACTELKIIKKLTHEELFLLGLAYMADHPFLRINSYVSKDIAQARSGFAVVRGVDPKAKGTIGDILAFAKEDPANGKITQIALTSVNGINILPNVWYGVDLDERADCV